MEDAWVQSTRKSNHSLWREFPNGDWVNL